MKLSVRLLLCSLLVATIGTSALGGPYGNIFTGLRDGDAVRQESPIILAGANGHDTVGWLLPPTLWPSARFVREERCQQNHRSKDRDLRAASCASPSMRNTEVHVGRPFDLR